MNAAAARRVVILLVGWVALAWLVLRGAGWLQQLLALPPMFRQAIVGLLLVGLVLSVPLAWRLPSIGLVQADDDTERPRGGSA